MATPSPARTCMEPSSSPIGNVVGHQHSIAPPRRPQDGEEDQVSLRPLTVLGFVGRRASSAPDLRADDEPPLRL